MLIESKIRRANGTLVTLGKTRYAFVPDEDFAPGGEHVCEVNNPAHIQRFLSITEGYQVYSGEVFDEDDDQDKEPDQEPQGTGEDEGEGGDEGDDEGDVGQTDAMPLEAMTLNDLQALYEAELGRKPHHRAGMDKLIEEITAHRAGQE